MRPLSVTYLLPRCRSVGLMRPLDATYLLAFVSMDAVTAATDVAGLHSCSRQLGRQQVRTAGLEGLSPLLLASIPSPLAPSSELLPSMAAADNPGGTVPGPGSGCFNVAQKNVPACRCVEEAEQEDRGCT